MFNSPTIVIGPPRSGTTMTARVLQEWFGILMDAMPMEPHRVINPHGWYEDKRLVNINMLFHADKIDLKKWAELFRAYIESMERLNKPWGFKDPMLIPLLTCVMNFFESPTIVRCHRPKALMVKSAINKLGWKPQYADRRYDNDERMLDQQLKNHVHYRIDFDRDVTEETVLDFFENSTVLRYAS